MNFKTLSVVLTGLLLGLFLTLQTTVNAKSDSASLPLAELRAFSQVFKNIKANYVEDISDKELINNAIAGMVSKLDPHSSYLLPESFTDLKVNTTGKFGGLGIEVGMEDGFVKVISPIDGTPAMRAGILAGDLIVRIDGKPVKGMTLNDAVKLMRGKIKTPITVTIIRKKANKPLEITIIRDEIKIKSVRQKLLKSDFGYIRISQFQSRTTENLHQAIKTLQKENNNNKLKGLILDLRNNPGGVLNAAVGVSNTFLTDGLIVYTEGKIKDSNTKFKASGTDLLENAPLIVLINEGSASASEIVAGALQDSKRAIIMGTKSFGKGSVQTVMPMAGGAALKITTARYFTPLGRSIQAKGIEPDILVQPVTIQKEEKSPKLNLSEKDLSGHLSNPNKDEQNLNDDKNLNEQEVNKNQGENKDKEKLTEPKKDKNTADLINEDFILYEALNLLKGLALLNQR